MTPTQPIYNPQGNFNELAFVDHIWPKIKENVDLSMSALDTSLPGVWLALTLAADTAVREYREHVDALA